MAMYVTNAEHQVGRVLIPTILVALHIALLGARQVVRRERC